MSLEWLLHVWFVRLLRSFVAFLFLQLVSGSIWVVVLSWLGLFGLFVSRDLVILAQCLWENNALALAIIASDNKQASEPELMHCSIHPEPVYSFSVSQVGAAMLATPRLCEIYLILSAICVYYI